MSIVESFGLQRFFADGKIWPCRVCANNYYYDYDYYFYYLTLKLFNLLTSALANYTVAVVMDVVTIVTTVLNSNGHRKVGA